MIHSAIQTVRPDVLCTAHSHPHGKVFSSLGIPLDTNGDGSACTFLSFHSDHVLYEKCKGIILDSVEGTAITTALGSKKAATLQNHGLLVVSSTIEATVHFYMALERACQVQLLADTSAAVLGRKTVKVNDAQGKETGSAVGSQDRGRF
ncbi:class II aldolase/adducin N-terminal, partial [Mycena galericulata]